MKQIIRFLRKTIIPTIVVVALFGCVPLNYAQEDLNKDDISFGKTKTRNYTLNLKQLIKETEKNIKKVENEIEEGKINDRNRKREDEVKKHFEKGNILHKEGKLKEAKKEWQKALKISKDPEMKGYIKESAKRAKKEE
ncbi:MAG: hypothetical protein KAS46_00720, partial [Candidatus Aureabacteria bacterium]|nr:hypothetical protein [Candidatus Auribacterota bacterium]